ncbi:hypothetical protein EBI_26280 [Enterocytozoon bieneusi H348]|nr:hypothetical protein EBI_26280 [Enterocytozoon bieneusi H348]|eukprot:XP_002650474.1 hypothetical protein EBI_26280 [Enterocytozoon bieneusi H348]
MDPNNPNIEIDFNDVIFLVSINGIIAIKIIVKHIFSNICVEIVKYVLISFKILKIKIKYENDTI